MTDQENSSSTKEVKDTELSLGERILKARKALDLSAEELVQFLSNVDGTSAPQDKGISLPTLYRYEKGEREPGAREIKLLCNALNVSPDWLLLGEAWNSEQQIDTEIANGLRILLQRCNDPQSNFLSRKKSRDNWHQVQLSEIKNRK